MNVEFQHSASIFGLILAGKDGPPGPQGPPGILGERGKVFCIEC